MSGRLRVRKAKWGVHAGQWVVRAADMVVIGRFPTGAEALAFVRRVIDAAA